MKKLLLSAVAACLLITTAQAQRIFTGQYSFGDSLSDNGNLFAITSRTQPPSPPYFGGRFSNGPVFTELLGNVILPAAPLSSTGTNRNFAYAGATAGPGGLVPDLGRQVQQYRVQGLPAQATDLFTVLAGNNDLIPVLSAPTTPTNPANLDVAGINAATAVATNVQALVGLGARNIVVAGLPNLGATPRAQASGGPGGPGATFGLRASNAFNTELRTRLATIASGAAGLNLVYVDVQGILDRIVLDYRALGYANATSYYLAPAALGGGVGDPNSYVFFDDIHPTAKTHSIFASVITEQLNPEGPLGVAATQGTAALALQGLAANALDDRVKHLAGSTRATGRAEAYASFNYGQGDREAEGARRRLSYTAQVVTAGVDLHASDGVFFGGAVNRGRLAASVRGGGGNFTVEDTAFRLYGVWHGGPVSFSIDGGRGAVIVKGIRRTTAFGGFQTNGKASGYHWGVGGRIAWLLESGGFRVSPWVGLRSERVTIERYTERDVPSLGMEFAEQKAKSSAGSFGIDLSTDTKMAGRNVHLDARVAWHGEMGSKSRTVSGKLANNFTPMSAVSFDDGDGSGVEVGGAVTLAFAKNWSASLGYAGDIRSGDKLAHRGTLSVQTGF